MQGKRIGMYLAGIVLSVSVLVVGGSKVVQAEEDLVFDGFYEYDMSTGKETEYMVNITDESSEDLILEGYPGAESGKMSETGEVHIVTEKKYDINSSKTYRCEWITRKGKWYYYNQKGKMLKNGMYEVEGEYYHFDKKGRRTSQKYIDSLGFNNVFSSKTGKLRYRYIPLKVTAVYKGKGGYSFNCISHKAPGSQKNSMYRISIGRNESNTSLVDENGKRVKASKIGKGAVLKVYTKSMEVLEPGVRLIPNITKITVIKKGKK